MLNIILLSGGSGKRLWPLSNDIRSKQFLKLFKNETSGFESMVQRVFRQLKSIDSECNITVATSKFQVSALNNQLGENVSLSVEPARRDTFPAIALATAYLCDVQHVSRNDSVVVMPVDPYVNDDYFIALKEMGDIVKKGKSNLLLLGVEPTYPSEKYGYIIPHNNEMLSRVEFFKEKPCVKEAKEYIRQGGLWNAGVFAFQASYVLDKSKELLGTNRYLELFQNYDNLSKISFDYAVVEREKNILVKRYGGTWIDLGTWNTLTDVMDEDIVGDAVIGKTCKNVHIINELEVPILVMGIKDAIVSASPDGVLVSDIEQSGYIKQYVEGFKDEVRFAEKSWGNFKVIDVESESLTIKVDIKCGDRMNYHSHDNRDEVWVVVNGRGITIVDGMEQRVEVGDVITMQAGCRHTIIAETDLILIEVQLGKDINVADKHKFPLEY